MAMFYSDSPVADATRLHEEQATQGDVEIETEREVIRDIVEAIVKALAILDKDASDTLLKAIRPSYSFPNNLEKSRVESLRVRTYREIRNALPLNVRLGFDGGIDEEVLRRIEDAE